MMSTTVPATVAVGVFGLEYVRAVLASLCVVRYLRDRTGRASEMPAYTWLRLCCLTALVWAGAVDAAGAEISPAQAAEQGVEPRQEKVAG